MGRHSLETRWSCLQRYIGLRINLFRAMHDARFHLADDRTVLATRAGDYALAVCIEFDPVFSYHYVRDCGWYRSDLSRLGDEEVPDEIREDLVRQLRAVLG